MSRIEELAVERGELVLTRWPTDLPGAFDADSDDALVYLPPILGCTQVIALHHIAWLFRIPDTVITILNVADFAQALGLAPPNGANAKIIKVFGRLERFGYIRHAVSSVQVRTTIPALSRRNLERMPDYLRATAPTV